MATVSSRRPTRLFSSMPKAWNCGGRPPSVKVTISGPAANAARVPICSASSTGW